ncbi:hypothetical protein B0H14DRAFT_2647399 [Mycena olivaceomarginata]|nr:hypothetical protein B0H14DRAFT_2647399 [Mycena olivaceomarginata]
MTLEPTATSQAPSKPHQGRQCQPNKRDDNEMNEHDTDAAKVGINCQEITNECTRDREYMSCGVDMEAEYKSSGVSSNNIAVRACRISLRKFVLAKKGVGARFLVVQIGVRVRDLVDRVAVCQTALLLGSGVVHSKIRADNDIRGREGRGQESDVARKAWPPKHTQRTWNNFRFAEVDDVIDDMNAKIVRLTKTTQYGFFEKQDILGFRKISQDIP